MACPRLVLLLQASLLGIYVHAFGPVLNSDRLTCLRRPYSSHAIPRNLFGRNKAPKDDVILTEDSLITPDGYGFTTPASRILKVTGRSNVGFVKAKGSDSVIDVMQAITDGTNDVALVFEDHDPNTLLGLFTETDYIRVSYSCGW